MCRLTPWSVKLSSASFRTVPASRPLPCHPSWAHGAWQIPTRGGAEPEVGAASLLGDAASAGAIPSFWYLPDSTWLLYADAHSPLEMRVSGTSENKRFPHLCQGWDVFHENAATLCFMLAVVSFCLRAHRLRGYGPTSTHTEQPRGTWAGGEAPGARSETAPPA